MNLCGMNEVKVILECLCSTNGKLRSGHLDIKESLSMPNDPFISI